MTTPPTITAAPVTIAPGTGTTSPVAGGGRLRNGELRRQVAALLAAEPARDFTPGEIARHLVRSAGAVGNALTVLAGHGEAEQTSTKPMRYRATATTAAAGTGATPSAPVAAARPPRAARAAAAAPSAAPAPTPSAPTGPVATTAPAAEDTPVTGPVARPNGQLYHPRQLSGMPDVTALRKLRTAGVAALMYGPPGTGKTSVVEAAFPDLVTVQGDGDTTVADLVGEYTQTPDGRYVFVHGPLVVAMREGRPLFIDDAVRHEAPYYRVEVEDLHRRAVAAA